jgi:hypothetical protein
MYHIHTKYGMWYLGVEIDFRASTLVCPLSKDSVTCRDSRMHEPQQRTDRRLRPFHTMASTPALLTTKQLPELLGVDEALF